MSGNESILKWKRNREQIDKLSFEDVYVNYFPKLVRFSQAYVISHEEAENIVHDVFVDLWKHWDTVSKLENPFSYLFVSVKNKSLDFLRRNTLRREVRDGYSDEYLDMLSVNYEALDSFDKNYNSLDEVYATLEKVIESLPEKCREIFIKSKIEGLKQKEIAKELGITINTVETQMGIAYKKLREELKEYFPIFILLLSFVNKS